VTDAPLLQTSEIAKRYGSVVALSSVDLVVSRGEVHGLVGANGAGKSTLVKILTGVLRPDSGTVWIDGRPVRLRSPAHARVAGLAPVFQDPAFARDLTIADNLKLTGTSPAAFRKQLELLEIRDVDLGARAGELALPLLRMLDLARSLAHDPRLILLDEITAALPSDYAQQVFGAISRARDAGTSVLFISHRLLEVQELCDRVTVLRDGRNVVTHERAEDLEQRIVAAMLGERAALAVTEPAKVAPERKVVPGEPALVVRNLSDGHRVRDVSFTLARGEVLGITGLEGQGQDELFSVLAGELRASGGEIVVGGQPLSARHPVDAIRRGLAFVPGDRLDALLPQRSIAENLATPTYNRPSKWGWINADRERQKVADAIERLSIDTRAQAQVKRLSGGNQQKVAIGRWLVAGFDTLLCFDPTRGIDVGTKHQIYDLFRELAEAGRSVLMFTSELREVPLACDRVLVMYGGRIVASMPSAEADEATLLNSAHGLADTLADQT
jgi:ribose transport system ATP-binding protein